MAAAAILIAGQGSSLAQEKGGPKIIPHCRKNLDAPGGCWRGLWIPLDKARRLLTRDNEYQTLMIKQDFLERMIDLRAKQLTARTIEADGLSAQLAKASDDARREKARADELGGRFEEAWRSPYVWLAVGLVTGGVTAGIVATR